MNIILDFLNICSTLHRIIELPQVVQNQLKIFFWKIIYDLKKKKEK